MKYVPILKTGFLPFNMNTMSLCMTPKLSIPWPAKSFLKGQN